MISRIILLCLCGALPFIHALPSYMVFPVGAETVEVPLKHTFYAQDNEAHEMSFTVNGNTFSLHLEYHDHVVMGPNTPVFLASKNTNAHNDQESITYEEIPNAMEQLSMVAFVDKEQNAYAVRSNDNEMMGLIVVNGLSFNFVVKNLSEAQPTISLTGPLDVLNKNTIDARNYDNSDEGIVAYPEMLVVLDNEFYEKNGRSWEKVVKYMFAHWTAVDLLFRSFENPRVRLNIAGLVIVTDSDAVPYKTDNAPKSLQNIRQYFLQRSSVLPKSDVISYIQYNTLANVRTDPFIPGAAFSGAICNSATGFMASTDDNSYSGVNVAARQLAHLLGAARHRADAEYCGNNSTNDLMDSFTIKSFDGHNPAMKFSQCTKHEIAEFLRTPRAQCIYNKPL